MGLLDSSTENANAEQSTQLKQDLNRNNEVIVSPKAVEEIKALKQKEEHPENFGLRLGVKGGGCSGLSYDLRFTEPRENDNVITYDDVHVYIDPKSYVYLKGIMLDYESGLKGKGFVFTNPNASNTCGCGESFSV